MDFDFYCKEGNIIESIYVVRPADYARSIIVISLHKNIMLPDAVQKREG